MDKDEVTELLSSPSNTDGWTNISDTLTLAVDMLCEQGNPNLPCVIVFLSDGNTAMGSDRDTDAALGKKVDAMQRARENGITIYEEKTIELWEKAPKVLREMFAHTFRENSTLRTGGALRLSADEWLKRFINLGWRCTHEGGQ